MNGQATVEANSASTRPGLRTLPPQSGWGSTVGIGIMRTY